MLSAEDIAAVKTAIEICNNPELKREILCAPGDINKKGYKYDRKRQWNEIVEKKATVMLESLGIAKQLQRKVMGVVLPIGMRMLIWAEYHEGTLGFSREYSVNFLNSSFFTQQGIIDNKKAAEELIKDDNLSIKQKYKLSCLYCFTDHIPALYRQMTKEDKEEFYDAERPQRIKQPELVKFWSYYLMGEVDKLKGEKNLDQYRLEKAVESGSKAAVEYCLEKTNLSRKKDAIVDATIEMVKNRITRWPRASHNDWVVFRDRYEDSEGSWIPSDYYVDILHFLLSKMRDDQKIEFLKQDIGGAKYKRESFGDQKRSRVLECFLNWPYQSYFMKTAELMWKFLPEGSYADLLLEICNKVESKKEENLKYGEEKSFDYRGLFEEFWCQSPEHYKRYVFSNSLGDTRVEENSISYKNDGLLSKLLKSEKLISSIDEKNIELIKLILNDAIPEEKERVISSLEWGGMCNKLMIEERWELLEELIERCTFSKEQINQFKKEFSLYWNVLSYLVRHDKFFMMDEAEKWSTRSEEETKESKRRKIFSQHGKRECFNLIMEDKLEFADKFVRWSLSSEEEIKEFKKEFVYSFGHSICKDLIARSEKEDLDDQGNPISRTIKFYGGKWEQVEMFLTWTFSSEEGIGEFKKGLFKASGAAIHDNLIKANRWEEAETFFAWLGLSKQEIKELKKENLFYGQMFSELIFSKEGDEEFLIYGGRQQAIELFLRWHLIDKETIFEFQDSFRQQFDPRDITEKDEVAFKDFDLAIEQCLSNLAEEKRGVKRKTEALDLPDKKLCSTKVDRQTCDKHL